MVRIDQGRIASCVLRVHELLASRDVWHAIFFGTLLGAVRDGDVIPWDYDFDFVVRDADVPRIMRLGRAAAAHGLQLYRFRSPASDLAMTWRPLRSFDSGRIVVAYRGERVGDLFAYSLFRDGVLRRFDFDAKVYWTPHWSFPHYFVSELGTASLRGHELPCPRDPHKLLEGFYGRDWRVPYRAVAQGGKPRAGTTKLGHRSAPRLAKQIAWCEARGWDRSRYARARAWPRDIAGAGPIGPCPRTVSTSRALWWRDKAELLEHF